MDSKVLLDSFGWSCSDEKCLALLKKLKLPPIDMDAEETSFYVLKKDLGLALEVTEGGTFEEMYRRPAHGARFVVSSCSFFSSAYGNDYHSFDGLLPAGLDWTMSVAQVSTLMGSPGEEDPDTKALTIYWRKRGGLDYVCEFDRTAGKISYINVGFANMFV